MTTWGFLVNRNDSERNTGGANNDFGLVLVNSEMSVTGGANNDFGLSC